MIYSAPNIYTLMYLEAIGKASAAMRQKYHDAIREGMKYVECFVIGDVAKVGLRD